MNKSPYDILKTPLITEDALKGQEIGKYAFRVDKAANKQEIKSAVESAFGVRVRAVHTTTIKSRDVRNMRTGRRGKKSSWKKAVITLEPGQALELS